MPEMPEVETLRRGLDGLLRGQRILGCQALWPPALVGKSWEHDPWPLEILGSGRRGKLLWLKLEGGMSLAVHLRMTGQLVFVGPDQDRFGAGHPTASLGDNLPDSSTRVVFRLDRGQLFYNDQRKFGRLFLLPPGGLETLPFLQTLGPEILDPPLGPEEFCRRLKAWPGRGIKALLLDQRALAGVGNIYADEALWAAALHPLRPAGGLLEAECRSLQEALVQVLSTSLDHGGSSLRNYVDARGKMGSYMAFAKVFDRQGQPCPRCGAPIVKIRCAGRGTHLCPRCQVAPEA